MVGKAEVHNDPEIRKALANKHKTDKNLRGLIILLKIFLKQGIYRNTRVIFWKYLWQMWKHNRAGIGNYLSYAAFIEHFIVYRKMVKDQIQGQTSLRKETTTEPLNHDIELSAEKQSEIIWYEPELEPEETKI